MSLHAPQNNARMSNVDTQDEIWTLKTGWGKYFLGPCHLMGQNFCF